MLVKIGTNIRNHSYYFKKGKTVIAQNRHEFGNSTIDSPRYAGFDIQLQISERGRRCVVIRCGHGSAGGPPASKKYCTVPTFAVSRPSAPLDKAMSSSCFCYRRAGSVLMSSVSTTCFLTSFARCGLFVFCAFSFPPFF